jgi:hypothetical protein
VILSFSKLWYLDIVWVEFYVVVIFGIVHFTAVIMPKFFFGLTGINVFMDFSVIFFFSPENMSSDDSPPRVRQRIEESIADRHHRMQSRQVLSERNLLHADLRDLVLLPISQMLLENQWEYLYNCAYPAFPRLVREFYGNMIIIQDDDRGLIIQTMVRGQTILIDH